MTEYEAAASLINNRSRSPQRRGIQYAADSRFNHDRLWNTGSPDRVGRWQRTSIADTPSQPRGAFRPSFDWWLCPEIQEGAGKAGCRPRTHGPLREDVAQKDRTAA